MEWYLKVVRDNYANFKGRARRKEYWMFVLFNIIISAVLGLLDNILNLNYGPEEYGQSNGILGSIYSLAILLPSLAVLVRRLHDTGKSGWNILWILTGIGAFYILYLVIKEGDRGSNEYGSDPKGFGDENPFENNSDTNNPFSGANNPFNNDANPFKNNP